MARISRADWHVLSLTFSKGKVFAYCTCQTVHIGRFDSEAEAQAEFELHKAQVKSNA